MSERGSSSARVRPALAVPVCALALMSCIEAHDVDARDGRVRVEPPSAAGRGGGGPGMSDAGPQPAGHGGSGGAPGNGGEPVFGDVSSCAPCEGSTGMSGDLEPCCTAAGLCGLDVGPLAGGPPTCVRQNAPGTDTTACPVYNFGGFFPLTSCCAADGACGVRIMQTAPLGCVDPALLGDMVTAAMPGTGGRVSCNAVVD